MKNLELFNTFEKQNSFFQSEIALTSALTTYLRKIGDGSKEDIYARLEDLIELDYDDFVQYFSEPRHLANHAVEETVYQVIADKRLLSIQEAQNEVHHYGYLLDILEKSSRLAALQTASELSDKISDPETFAKLLAKYMVYHGITKKDLTKRIPAVYPQLCEMIDHRQDPDSLHTINDELMAYERMQKQYEDHKILSRLLQKAQRKFRHIQKRRMDAQDKMNCLLLLEKSLKDKMQSFQPLSAPSKEAFDHYFDTLQQEVIRLSQIPDVRIEPEKPEKPPVSDQDVQLIERFYTDHHLAFKKNQLMDELSEFPELPVYFQRYEGILSIKEAEEKLKALDELESDINEDNHKKTDGLVRLTQILKQYHTELLEAMTPPEPAKPEKMSEPVVIPVKESSDQFLKIGKFLVVKGSDTPNPLNISQLARLLSDDSQDKIGLLEKLIFQIGYDKVHAYLSKHPHIHIYDLESIIKTDRQLRFEYQKRLEEIEMYFRSSLTYYLTNKYDKKYKMAYHDGYFYYRAYLDKSLFNDKEEHYNLISQLNDRIDNELKNNQQVTEEYRQYRYSLNFATAAGIMPFGWVLNLFQTLNLPDRVSYLARYFQGLSVQTFYAWMISLNNLRNRCAHYQSLYRLSSFKELRPIMTKDKDANNQDRQHKSTTLFYYTLIMIRLCPDILSAEDFIDSLTILFRKAHRENYTFDLEKDYSFPANWQHILEVEKSARIGAM